MLNLRSLRKFGRIVARMNARSGCRVKGKDIPDVGSIVGGPFAFSLGMPARLSGCVLKEVSVTAQAKSGCGGHLVEHLRPDQEIGVHGVSRFGSIRHAE